MAPRSEGVDEPAHGRRHGRRLDTITADVRANRRLDGTGVGNAALSGLALLVALQVADHLTFLVMVRMHGLAAEVNPIVLVLAGHGLALLTVAKVAAIVLVASTFLVSRQRRPQVARLTLCIGIVMGAMGAFSNLATLYAFA